IVVPGNHDVPFDHARLHRPFNAYRSYISEELEPFYADDELAIAGVNTARRLTIKNGRINTTQIAHIEERLCRLPADVIKIVITHHPFDLPQGYKSSPLVGRAAQA